MEVKKRDIQKQLVKELVGIRRTGAYNLGYSGMPEGMLRLVGIDPKHAVANLVSWLKRMDLSEDDKAVFQFALGLDAKNSALDVSSRRKLAANLLGVSDRTVLRREDVLIEQLAEMMAQSILDAVAAGATDTEDAIQSFFNPTAQAIVDGVVKPSDVQNLVRSQATILKALDEHMEFMAQMYRSLNTINEALASRLGIDLDDLTIEGPTGDG